MLSIVHVDRIQDCLRSVSGVVDAQQRRDADFPRKVLEWLTHAEAILHDARQASLSQISALRSHLLSTQYSRKKNTGQSRRVTLEAAASEALAKGQGILSTLIEPRLSQIAEGESLALRVLAVASVKGLLQTISHEKKHQDKLKDILEFLKKDTDTAAATAHFLGILGPVDALIILDRALGNRLES